MKDSFSDPHVPITGIQLTDDTLLVASQHRTISVPIAKFSSLRNQPQEVLQNLQIDPDGSFIYWPDIDVHLGWYQFLRAIDPEELRKAQQLTKRHNRRYGAAIRRFRKSSELRQSDIPGLTDRQLRRIEQGKCRATSDSIELLAKAHSLEANAYLRKIAKELDRSTLSPRDLARVLKSGHPGDYIISGHVSHGSETLVLRRGNSSKITVSFSFFTHSPLGDVPDFDDFEITDCGQTVRLGKYEAATDAILYELDPEYKKAIDAKRTRPN